jgi:hypothetical protein
VSLKTFVTSLFRSPKADPSRRLFLRGVVGGVAALALAPVLKVFASKPPPLTAAEKELIFSQALVTEEARAACAMAMVEPIRRSLEYQAVGRKLLMVDELPTHALARYRIAE